MIFLWNLEVNLKNKYNKEYEQYFVYALEQFLVKTKGYSDYDAKIKVMQNFEEVKEEFEKNN